MKLQLHDLAENVLEAPALAWSSLAWYWGLSFLGMSPRYYEYMQSGENEVDSAFFFNPINEEISRIPGYEQPVSIKQRFDKAVDYYEYCFIAGKQSSINPPWDYPPDLQTLIAFRNKMESKPQSPNATVEANAESVLDEQLSALWKVGGQLQREDRALKYANQVKEALHYVHSEVQPRMSLTIEQLNKDTGFLDHGNINASPLGAGVTPFAMDEAMPQEKQWEKLGDSYKQTTPYDTSIVSFGIIGRYYKSGHSLELAMWSPEKARELSFAHNATIRTWRQLMDVLRSATEEELCNE